MDLVGASILRPRSFCGPHTNPRQKAPFCAASGGGLFLQAWGLRAGLAKSPELSFMDAGGARRLRKASGIYLKPRSGAFLLGLWEIAFVALDYECQGFP